MYVVAQLAHHGHSGDRGWVHLVFVAVVIVMAGLFVFRMIRHKRGYFGPGHHGNLSALSVLQERFARGEINEREFTHRKAVLRGEASPPAAPDSDSADGAESADR